MAMTHEIHKVVSFQKVAPFTLRVNFDDASSQVINFKPVLKGELYGPLQNPELFDQVQLDLEAHTLVWPDGADFDPAMLHNWSDYVAEFEVLSQNWGVPAK
jgi:hypothetical protein